MYLLCCTEYAQPHAVCVVVTPYIYELLCHTNNANANGVSVVLITHFHKPTRHVCNSLLRFLQSNTLSSREGFRL